MALAGSCFFGISPLPAKPRAATLSPVSDSPTASLDGIFRPRSVAVVGAGRREGTIGRQVVANIISAGFTGPVYPVNPKSPVVHSVPTVARVADVPGPLDLAILVVPAEEVLKVAEQCGKKGVRGLVVITAGFREIGGVGLKREAKLQSIASRYGMRVVGPNCMGIINSHPEVRLNGSFSAVYPGPGGVAMVSQSGALGEAILADAAAAGLGVSMFASVGNRADVTAADLIEYWEDKPEVRVILLYIEAFGDPTRFVAAASRVGRKKPIIAVKAGRSAAGQAAAGSHTGAVMGADAAADTMLAQAGVLRVDSFREMFGLAAALMFQPVPKGDRMAVLTNAGGPGILATDALVGCGLRMADLAPKSRTALTKVLPPEASVQNPVDLIASANAESYRKALRILVRDPGIDGLLVLFVSPVMIDAEAVAQAIVDESKGCGKPVMACVMGRQRGLEALQLLTDAGVTVFRYPEDAVMTMRRMVTRNSLAQRKRGPLPQLTPAAPTAAKVLGAAVKRAGRREDSGDGVWLSGADAMEVLTAYGVPFPQCRFVPARPGDAVEAAAELGYPVALKAEAAGLVHKSEEGAVFPGLKDGDQVLAAARDLVKRLKPGHRDLKFLVQRMAGGHRELLLGMNRDPRYGPTFAVGLGGTLVEVMQDVAFRVAPMDAKDPAEMFAGLKGAALLGTFRGQPAVQVKRAEEVLLRLQQLALDHPEVVEVEINPFIAGAKRADCVAVDARIRVVRP